MKELGMNEDALKVVRLYLEKVELLNPREREILLKTIDLLNHPLYITT